MESKFNPENLRVGRAPYYRGKYTFPTYEDFKPIIILTKGMGYDTLSPFFLKNSKKQIFENIYQAHKIYRILPENVDRNSHTGVVNWVQNQEVHVDDKGNLTPAYFAYRERLMNHPNWVRYPCGYKNTALCAGSLLEGEDHILNYVESRIKIYATLYIQLIWELPEFKEIIELLKMGQKLLIIEVDGPHGEDLEYYKTQYKVADDFIIGNTMIATPENIGIMLHDTKNKWGHCYALTWAILLYFQCAGNLPTLKLENISI